MVITRWLFNQQKLSLSIYPNRSWGVRIIYDQFQVLHVNYCPHWQHIDKAITLYWTIITFFLLRGCYIICKVFTFVNQSVLQTDIFQVTADVLSQSSIYNSERVPLWLTFFNLHGRPPTSTRLTVLLKCCISYL